ncbi:MAG: hypothetical protein WD469_06180 [Paenibacillaceae bacterium]
MKLNQMNGNIFEQFQQATTLEANNELRAMLESGGYSLFSLLLEGLKAHLITCDEISLEQAKQLIVKGREIVPQPFVISPSWEKVWEEMEHLIFYKGEALRSIPLSDRDGEWQIIMDNPFTNEGVTCYPALSFADAAYLYGYFRRDLRKNEYIRLQKIVNVVISQGD